MSSLISDLQIGKKIGEGYFGEVFLGNDPVHGDVAVKRLVRDSANTDDEWNARKAALLNEAQHLRQASHPNVVKVHHLLEDVQQSAILYVMDFCDGGSLQSAFEAGPMDLAKLRNIATEITHGLQALHLRGMLHRDIKPSNVLLKRGVAQLGDFGLVTDDLILGYGSQVGYLNHIAPEVHAGRGTSVRTDIWALGMTIYRLLHGSQWYSESPVPLKSVPDGGYADTLRWLPHVPKKWRKIVRAMLRDDPARRYQTATEVFEALSNLPAKPIWQCSVSAPEVLWKRSTDSRRMFVRWQRHSLRRHEWRAWSEPRESGRNRKLDGSDGVSGIRATEAGLRSFFGD